MTTQLKLTKRQREVVHMMRSGWDLYVLANNSRNRKPRAFLVPIGTAQSGRHMERHHSAPFEGQARDESVADRGA